PSPGRSPAEAPGRHAELPRTGCRAGRWRTAPPAAGLRNGRAVGLPWLPVLTGESRFGGGFPETADEDQLSLDRTLAAVEVASDLGAGVLLELEPGEFAKILVGQQLQQSVELLGNEDGKLRGRLAADDLVEVELFHGGRGAKRALLARLAA